MPCIFLHYGSKGYKNAKQESNITLNKWLNILVGENGSGKTAIINALRLILRENESYTAFSEDDFYCSLDKKDHANEAKITADFYHLTEVYIYSTPPSFIHTRFYIDCDHNIAVFYQYT